MVRLSYFQAALFFDTPALCHIALNSMFLSDLFVWFVAFFLNLEEFLILNYVILSVSGTWTPFNPATVRSILGECSCVM